MCLSICGYGTLCEGGVAAMHMYSGMCGAHNPRACSCTVLVIRRRPRFLRCRCGGGSRGGRACVLGSLMSKFDGLANVVKQQLKNLPWLVTRISLAISELYAALGSGLWPLRCMLLVHAPLLAPAPALAARPVPDLCPPGVSLRVDGCCQLEGALAGLGLPATPVLRALLRRLRTRRCKLGLAL